TERYEIVATAPDGGEVRVRDVAPAASEAPALELRVAPPRLVVVSVVDDTGTPIAGALVVGTIGSAQDTVRRPAGSAVTRADRTTDADGGFHFRGLPQGRYSIDATLGEGLLAMSARTVVDAGATYVPLVLHRESGVRVLVVHVVDPDGKPVAKARVRIRAANI